MNSNPSRPEPQAPQPIDCARAYQARGWQPIPVPRAGTPAPDGSTYDGKRPRGKGWERRRDVQPAQFEGQNVGVHLGPSGLIDVDLDCPEAVELAAETLPSTGATFGRASKPRSHWIYQCANVRYRKFVDPLDGSCILEIRAGEGKQSVFPGSVHESGEVIEWHESADPIAADPSAYATALALQVLVQRHGTENPKVLEAYRKWKAWLEGEADAADAPEPAETPDVMFSKIDDELIDRIAEHYPAKGSRHDYRLACAGACWRAGISQDATRAVLAEATERAGGSVVDVDAVVRDTWSATRPNTGSATLVEMGARAVADRIDALVTPEIRAVTWIDRLDETCIGGSLEVFEDSEIVNGLARMALAKDSRLPGIWARLKDARFAHVGRLEEAVKLRARELRRAGKGDDPRPAVLLGSADITRTVSASIPALAGADVFQRGPQIVSVHQVEAAAPRIEPVSHHRLREILNERIDYRDNDADGSEYPTRPPEFVAHTILARRNWPELRQLVGVTQWPTLRPDGSIFDGRGYDAQTRVWGFSTAKIDVPEEPTRADAQAAIAELLELVADFPFGAAVHRAVWLAALLTPLARHAFEGPTPMTLIDANERGSGKTLLADLIGRILTGAPLAKRTAPKAEEEWQKSIFSIALAGSPIALFDNVTKMLVSAALDGVLTGTEYESRVLGESRDECVPWRTCVIATANNAQISSDLVRRTVRARLDAPPNPEQRTGFRIGDIEAHVNQHRDRYLSAALTVLRAYVVAGRPAVTMRAMGSYTGWSSSVRAALIWAGQPDPAATQDELRDGSDPEHEEIGAFYAAWHEAFGDRAVRARDVIEALEPFGPGSLRDAVQGLGIEHPTAARLSYRLRSLRGRAAAGFRLEGSRSQDHDNSTLWQLSPTE